MHWLGLIVVILIASAVAMVLWQRLTDTQQKLASLHDELRRNEMKLQDQLSRLEAKKAEQEKEKEMRLTPVVPIQPSPEGEELNSPPGGRG